MAKTKPRLKKSQKLNKSSATSLTDDPQSQSTVSQTFHPFARLPIEVRLPIWALALPGPRILTIVIPNCTCTSTECPMAHKYHTPNHLPTLLSVCRESRFEILKSYVLIHAGYGFCLAFNSRTDAVHFRGEMNQWPYSLVSDALLENEEYRIRKLVINELGLESKDISRDAEEYMEMEEIVILLQRWDSMRLKLAPGDPRLKGETTRVLDPAVGANWENGWGNAGSQNEFLGLLMRVSKKMKKKCPVVKLVQWEVAEMANEFCIREGHDGER